MGLLLPLGLVIAERGHDRLVAAASSRNAAVAGAIATAKDAKAVRAYIAGTGATVVVHGYPGLVVGGGHAWPQDIERVSKRSTATLVETPDGEVYLTPARFAGGSAVVESFLPAAALDADNERIGWAMAAAALALLIAFIVGADRIAARLVRGITELRDGAVALGNGDLRARVEATGSKELTQAGVAFNRMADRLAQSRTSERELVADLSHRLRTPLTVLRLDAESLVGGGDVDSNGALDTGELFLGTPEEADHRRAIRRIRTAVAALEKEIDVLIRTTRQVVSTEVTDEEHDDAERCDAGDVVRDRMEFWAAVASDQERSFTVHGEQRRAPVALPRAELAAALDAVLGNVFRYTPQGTPFEVAVTRRDGYVAVRVDDGGDGIDDPERALVRGASDGGSTGLGLDIARRATLAADGSVSVDRAQLGGASVVMLFRDAEAAPVSPNRFGVVGRVAGESADRRWSRPRRGDES